MNFSLASLLFGLSLILLCRSSTIVQNNQPRVDVNGEIMDIHDGNTLLLNNTYFYYGASYGNCTEPKGTSGCSNIAIGSCGFRLDHNVSLYTSNDLGVWTPHPNPFEFARDNTSPGIMFCPKVAFSAMTKMFVLWYNWLPPDVSFKESYFGVAVSPSPFGPFRVVNAKASDSLAYDNVGDFALFVDDDGSGFIIYTAHISSERYGPYNNTHRMSVERLQDDFLSSQGAATSSGFFGSSMVEAPVLFKRDGVYYASFGFCCCYCAVGSAPFVYTAKSPLGPYSCALSGFLGQCGTLTPGIPAQQTNVLKFYDSHGHEQFLWQGDRWQSAPDGIKGHDMTYWGLMSWNFFGHLQPLKFVSQFNIDV